jgi:signal peptidase I
MSRRGFLATAAAAVALAGGAAGVRALGFAPVKILSGSMTGTVDRGQWVIVRSLDPGGRSGLRRGDIVEFRFPLGTSGRAIKRVAATGGDRVTFTDRTLTVNDRAQPITGSPRPGVRGALTVPRGHVFLLGDHARSSVDSRSFGSVPAGETVGRVVAVLPSSRVLVLLAGGALMAAAVASPRVRRSGRRRRRS